MTCDLSTVCTVFFENSVKNFSKKKPCGGRADRMKPRRAGGTEEGGKDCAGDMSGSGWEEGRKKDVRGSGRPWHIR